MLAQCKKSGSLWMSRQRKPMADPREWFANACKEAKIEGVTWHTLRHTFASRLVMARVDLKTLQDLMGHKTLAMTARYSHLSPEHKLKALENSCARPCLMGSVWCERAKRTNSECGMSTLLPMRRVRVHHVIAGMLGCAG